MNGQVIYLGFLPIDIFHPGKYKRMFYHFTCGYICNNVEIIAFCRDKTLVIFRSYLVIQEHITFPPDASYYNWCHRNDTDINIKKTKPSVRDSNTTRNFFLEI